MKLKFFLLFLFALPLGLIAQKIYSDTILNKNIVSLQLFRTGFNISDPIIELNTSEQLTLSFDEFGTESKYYYYIAMPIGSPAITLKTNI